LFEQKQSDHPSDRQGWAAFVFVQRREGGLELRPSDAAGELVQRLPGIQHRRQIRQEKLQLGRGVGVGLYCLNLQEFRPPWAVFL
jgi:hypothetical protein